MARFQGEALATCSAKLGFKITVTSRKEPPTDWSMSPIAIRFQNM
jgi:hypothetical protein